MLLTTKVRYRAMRTLTKQTTGRSRLPSLNETATSRALSERSEFARLGLNIVTVFSLPIFLSCPVFFLFVWLKKKELLVRVQGRIAPETQFNVN